MKETDKPSADVPSEFEAGRQAAAVEADLKPAPAKPKLSIYRRILRWGLSAVILFGLGALAVALGVVMPMQRSGQSRESALEAANQKISSLEATMESFSSLGSKTKGLETDLDQANRAIAILSARADVATAQLALAKKDPAKARLAVTNTPATFDKLAALLEPNQRQVVTDMKDRLNLALTELDTNSYAAESDLDVLMTALLQLESAILR
jgi:hypothetical protein